MTELRTRLEDRARDGRVGQADERTDRHTDRQTEQTGKQRLEWNLYLGEQPRTAKKRSKFSPSSTLNFSRPVLSSSTLGAVVMGKPSLNKAGELAISSGVAALKIFLTSSHFP